jgi:hypothetical protein
MNRTWKVIGKLSLWGIILGFLIWLGKQILLYLFALIKPWLAWLLGWLMLIFGALALLVVGLIAGIAYVGYRSWKRRREKDGERKENNQKAA